MRPRLHIELAQKQHTLSVTARIVYGDPPDARIDDGRLVMLRERVPTRDEAMERALAARLRDELHLVPGRSVHFDGADAIRFAQKLQGWKGGGAEAATKELFHRRRPGPPPPHRGRSLRRLPFDLGGGEGERPTAARPGPAARRRGRRSSAAFRSGLPLVPLGEGEAGPRSPTTG